MSFLQKRQEHILEAIDHLCFDDVCALFQEHSTASAEVVQAIADKVNLIIERNNGNRAQIEAVIRDELPTLLSEKLQALGAILSCHLERIASSTAQLATEQGRTIAHGANGNDGQAGDVVREDTASKLAPRLDALEKAISGHLDSIGRYAAQLAAGQDQTTDRLVTEIREIKVAQKRASEDIAALRESAGQALSVLKQT
jgi:hypothetical protein